MALYKILILLFFFLYLLISYLFFKDIIEILLAVLSVFAVFTYFLHRSFLSKQNDSMDMILQEGQKADIYDELTGLPNNDLFLDRVNQHVKHAIRENSTLSIVTLEISNLEAINVKYARKIGDKYLKQITLKLLKSVRDEDTVARVNGNDFSIVFHHTTEENITAIVAKIARNLQTPIMLGKISLVPEFHIGICMYSQDGVGVESLLGNARSAMKEAKDSSKIFQFYKNK